MVRSTSRGDVSGVAAQASVIARENNRAAR